MPRFSTNLSMPFTEVPFLERFGGAARAGFKAVKFASPYDRPPDVIAGLLRQHGLDQVLFNLPAGDWAAGERAATITRLMPRIGHFQIVGNPGRTQPDHGEIDYPFLFDLIDHLGYDGWIGTEYKPTCRTEDGLGWLRRFAGD